MTWSRWWFIGAVYTRAIRWVPLVVAGGIYAVVLVLRRAGMCYGTIFAVLGAAAWVAVLKSSIDPVVAGLVMGLAVRAHPATRTDLERTSDPLPQFP